MSEKASLSPVRRWGLALGAVLAVQNGFNHNTLLWYTPNKAELAQELRGFSRDWDVNTVEDFRQTQEWLLTKGHEHGFAEKRSFLAALTEAGQRDFIQSLSPDTQEYREYVIVSLYYRKLPSAGIAAFDYGRAVNNCRLATLVGFIEAEEAWERILHIARLAQASYADWQEYIVAYLAGRQYWRGDLSKELREKHTGYMRELLLSDKSPWLQLDWDTKLD